MFTSAQALKSLAGGDSMDTHLRGWCSHSVVEMVWTDQPGTCLFSRSFARRSCQNHWPAGQDPHGEIIRSLVHLAKSLTLNSFPWPIYGPVRYDFPIAQWLLRATDPSPEGH